LHVNKVSAETITDSFTQVVNQNVVTIDSIYPSSGNQDTAITLYGSGFGDAPTVYLYSSQGDDPIVLPIFFWDDTVIKTMASFVKGNHDYQVVVETASGARSNSVNFRVDKGQPRISSITPNSAHPGEQITIIGEDFGDDKGVISLYGSDSNTVTLNCTISSWLDAQVACSLPASLDTGKYWVSLDTADGRRAIYELNISAPVVNNPSIGNVTIAPCGSTSCGTITTAIITGSNFEDSIKVEAVGVSDGNHYGQDTFSSPDVPYAVIVGKTSNNQLIVDFHGLPCNQLYKIQLYYPAPDSRYATTQTDSFAPHNACLTQKG